MQNRYLIQFRNSPNERYKTAYTFPTGQKNRQAAIEYLDWLMQADNAPQSGRVYDRENDQVIHTINRE